MREFCERRIKVGHKRDTKKIFDEIEQVVAKMRRESWILDDSIADELLGYIDIFFYREIDGM